MIRAFVAVDLPESARQTLERTSQDLRKLKLDGRPGNLESIHLTLKFLGNIETGQIEPLRQALQQVASRSESFSLQLRGVGVFPDLTRPRVIWFGIESSEALTRLQADAESALSDLGFPPEGRPFKPHLTLMRLKSARNIAEFTRYLRQAGFQAEGEAFAVEEFHLFQSVLKPSGAEYRKLATFRLGVDPQPRPD